MIKATENWIGEQCREIEENLRKNKKKALTKNKRADRVAVKAVCRALLVRSN